MGAGTGPGSRAPCREVAGAPSGPPGTPARGSRGRRTRSAGRKEGRKEADGLWCELEGPGKARAEPGPPSHLGAKPPCRGRRSPPARGSRACIASSAWRGETQQLGPRPPWASGPSSQLAGPAAAPALSPRGVGSRGRTRESGSRLGAAIKPGRREGSAETCVDQPMHRYTRAHTTHCAHICTCMHIHLHTGMYMRACACIRTCAHTCTLVCTCIHKFACAHAYQRVHPCARAHWHGHACTYTHVHAQCPTPWQMESACTHVCAHTCALEVTGQ